MPTTSPRASTAFLFVLLLACGDVTDPVRDEPGITHDLVFDGEDALGQRVLFRVALDDSVPRLIGD